MSTASSTTTIDYRRSAWQDALPEAGSVDLAICDPIYDNPDMSYIEAAWEALRPGGSLYIFSDYAGVAQTKLATDAAGFTFQNWLIWGPNDWGGRPSRAWGQKHDDILFYTKPGAIHHFDGQAVAVPKKMTQTAFNPSGRTTKVPNSVWHELGGFSTLAKERVKILGHVARWQKPEKVIERLVLASSRVSDYVWDPFGGVATVATVCAKLGRGCLSTEIDRYVYEAGAKRLKPFLTDAL